MLKSFIHCIAVAVFGVCEQSNWFVVTSGIIVSYLFFFASGFVFNNYL